MKLLDSMSVMLTNWYYSVWVPVREVVDARSYDCGLSEMELNAKVNEKKWQSHKTMKYMILLQCRTGRAVQVDHILRFLFV